MFEEKFERLERLCWDIFEEWFYFPECMNEEEAADWSHDQQHNVYSWTDEQNADLVNALPDYFSRNDVIWQLSKMGYKIA